MVCRCSLIERNETADKRPVDYLEKQAHDFWKEKLLLSFPKVFSGALNTTSWMPFSYKICSREGRYPYG